MQSRKFFSSTVVLPAATATSLATLMQDSILHWGLQDDLVNPSMDSFLGDEASITPDSTVYVGNDANVRNADATPLYKGVAVTASQNYSLQDFGARGNIDPNAIWLYSAAGANIVLVFQAA